MCEFITSQLGLNKTNWQYETHMGKLGIVLPVIVGIFILMSVESQEGFASHTPPMSEVADGHCDIVANPPVPGVDYSKCPFVDVILSNADLSNANFAGAILYNSDLQGANLAGADLTDTLLSQSDFSNANLAGADLSRSMYDDTIFSNANLAGADLSNSKSQSAKFIGADLSGSIMSGAGFEHAYFTGADLSNAQIYGSNLKYADLTGANLDGASQYCIVFVEGPCSSIYPVNANLHCYNHLICIPDADGDLVHQDTDCDDNNPNRFPNNIEIEDGQDNNCNGIIDDLPVGITCGLKTVLNAQNLCVPKLLQICGSGTTQDATNSECIPDPATQLSCGSGTVTSGTECISVPVAQVTCASGTTLNTSTNQCEAIPTSQITCGTGTMLDTTTNECVLPAGTTTTEPSPITISTRDASYIFGDRIDIDGLVNGATDRVDVDIKILDPSGVIVKENDERTNPNGEFDTSASSGTTNNWVLSGTYAVEVTSDTLSGQTTFSFAGTDSEFGFGGTLSETIPPVQQMKSGISPADVECRFGLEPIQKPTGSVACVRSSSIEKLLDIGWNLVQ